MSRFDRFLDSISPERTLHETESRVDHALISFPSDVAKVQYWNEFEDVLAGFYCHLENHILALAHPRVPDRQIDFARCVHVLQQHFGPRGEVTAYELSRTGIEGGLPNVLRTIAQHLTQHYVSTELRAKVSFFLHSLTAEETRDYAEEYARRYRDLLPPEYTSGTAVDVAVNFWKILEEHPRALERVRRAVR